MDWFLSALTCLGLFLAGRKNRWGWLVMGVCSLLWVFYALYMLNPPQYGLVPAAVINVLISFHAFFSWNERGKYLTKE